MNKAQEIYNTETLIHLQTVGDLLTKIVNESEKHILTDQEMLKSASKTRIIVLFIGLIAVFVSIALAIIIARNIVNSLNKGIDFAKKIADGDLTSTIEINQKDERDLIVEIILKPF